MVFAQISSFLLLMALLVFRQHSPINHVLLGGFTLCMSYMVATAGEWRFLLFYQNHRDCI